MKTQIRTLPLALLAIAASTAGAESMFQLGENSQLHFVADAALVYEDNVFLASTDEESDTHLEFSPGVEWRISPEGAATTILRYQHRFTMYQDFDELDSDFADLSFQTRYDSGVVLASANASYKEEYSNTFDLDSSADVFGVLISRDSTRIGGSLKYGLSELTALQVGINYADVNYQDIVVNGITVREFIDSDSTSVPLTVFYRVKPKVDLTAGFRYRTTDTTGDITYDDMYYFVGAVGELFSPVVYADLTIGYQDRQADGNLADSASASYDLSFIYTGNAKSTLYAKISRDYRTSASQASSYAFSSVSFGGNYSVSNMVSLNASLVLAESEYEESTRAEDITMGRIGASYRPNDYLTVNASYSYRDVDGNVAKYTDNEFRVSASLRY